MILVFLGLYIRQLNKEKKELEDKANQITKKEAEVDSNFHQAVNQTIGQERKIIEDAAAQAKEILTQTKYVSDASKQVIEQALQKMLLDAQQQVANSSNDIMSQHQKTMAQFSNQSLTDFQNITKQFEAVFQKQLEDFRISALASLKKDIDTYKDKKLKDAEKTVNSIIQQVAQKVLNKSLSSEDHQKLIIESLEKARKEGLFN
jgi:hypothetical protein